MALVAAIAVLFEAIPFLSGRLRQHCLFLCVYHDHSICNGNEYHQHNTRHSNPWAWPCCKAIWPRQLLRALSRLRRQFHARRHGHPASPAHSHGQALTGLPPSSSRVFAYIGLAILLTLLAALFFDRFDPSRSKPRRTSAQRSASPSAPEPASTSQALPTVHLTPLNKAANRFSFFTVLIAELKLLLKGQRWWWYAVAAGLSSPVS